MQILKGIDKDIEKLRLKSLTEKIDESPLCDIQMKIYQAMDEIDPSVKIEKDMLNYPNKQLDMFKDESR